MTSYKDELLIGICEKLQLSSSLYDQAEKRYHAISEIIQSDSAFKNIELKMYPHGSFRLKTTVKPLSENEYDLDFVVEIPKDVIMTPQQLYNHIYRILLDDGIHSNMVEKKARCIRVSYANDFHMDIMPGQAINKITNEIIVPDHELKGWYHHSNPIRYAEWFENQAKRQILNEMNQYEKHKASTEPISDQEDARELEPLRRAVQLIKRYRDIYCNRNNKEPVRSIVICTLMGYISSSYASEMNIIRDFCVYVNSLIEANNGEPFEVRNPVVDEILTEKWKENKKNYLDFVGMIISLTKDMQKLSGATVNTDIVSLIKEMFGEDITSEVIKEQAKKITQARKEGELSVGATGILNTAKEGTLVKKNTFYGE